TLGRLLREKIPFFVLAAVSCVITLVAQKNGGAVAALSSLPFGARAGNALVSYVRYLGKLFWPTNLSIIYPHPGSWPAAEVAGAGLLIGALSLGVLWLS